MLGLQLAASKIFFVGKSGYIYRSFVLQFSLPGTRYIPVVVNIILYMLRLTADNPLLLKLNEKGEIGRASCRERV